MDGPKATEQLRDLAEEYRVQELSELVLGQSGFDKWSASGSSHSHHYGRGGLAVHTLEVVNLSLQNNEFLKAIEPKIMFLAALFHDVGKLWDYEPKETEGENAFQEWKNTEHKAKIHHVVKSGIIWVDAWINSAQASISFEEKDEILHAILAHHGQKEWGSPVTPQTKMAWILHLSDMISARCFEKEKL